MSRTTPLWQLLAVAGAASLVLAACAGDDAPGAPVAGAEPLEEEPEEEQEEESPSAEFEPVPMLIGTMMPQTGDLADFGLGDLHDAWFEPIQMGIAEINALYPDLITIDPVDAGTDGLALQNVGQFLTGEHHAILGPAEDSKTFPIVDRVQDAGVVMCSGSNTGWGLSMMEPYYIRTAPHDLLESQTLAELIAADGFADVAVIWRPDFYEGAGQALVDTLEGIGLNVTLAERYNPDSESFADVVDSVTDSGAEALAIIPAWEGAQIVFDMQGRFDGQVYVSSAFLEWIGPDEVGGQAELIEGFRGTRHPDGHAEGGEATFPDRFAEWAPDAPSLFSAHFYDCLMVVVLSAQAAQNNDPTVYVDEIVGITGPPGTKCSRFADCMSLLEAGDEIDYDGASGPLDFVSNGEPGAAFYAIVTLDAEGTPIVEQHVLTLSE